MNGVAKRSIGTLISSQANTELEFQITSLPVTIAQTDSGLLLKLAMVQLSRMTVRDPDLKMTCPYSAVEVSASAARRKA